MIVGGEVKSKGKGTNNVRDNPHDRTPTRRK